MNPNIDSRLAIVLSHPTQYYSPWFVWLHRNCDLKFKVFYLWNSGVSPTRDPHFQKTFSWDVDLLNGYELEFVVNISASAGTEHFRGLDNPQLFQKLKDYKPKAILLFGYKYYTHLRLIIWAQFRNIPLIFRGDSHFLGRFNRSIYKTILLSLLYRQFSAITYVGHANHAYFRALGVSESRLFFSPHSVNDALFCPNEANQAKAFQKRQSLGIANKRVFLYAGKFIQKKQPCELLKAFLKEADPKKHSLVFVGDGPLKKELTELAYQNPEYKISVLPFENQSEMPSTYLMGDIFVLPSRSLYETWGLAVNEAMHMGLPCLISDLVGCQEDLVTEGETGWVFSANSFDSLAAKLRVALSVSLEEFRPRVLKRISRYKYDSTSEGLFRAIAFVGDI